MHGWSVHLALQDWLVPICSSQSKFWFVVSGPNTFIENQGEKYWPNSKESWLIPANSWSFQSQWSHQLLPISNFTCFQLVPMILINPTDTWMIPTYEYVTHNNNILLYICSLGYYWFFEVLLGMIQDVPYVFLVSLDCGESFFFSWLIVRYLYISY